MFENAKWIWSHEAIGTDSYSEFLISHEFHRGNCVKLRISADSNYAVYVNGVFADSGQYADFPHYKVYDELDLSDYLITGINYIAIIVWHYGVQSFTYYMGKPGLLFELEQNSKVVATSGEEVFSRKSRRYLSGTNESITMMLGLNYHVDLKESDAWMVGTDVDGFAPSIIQADMPEKLHERIAKKLQVLPLVKGELVSQGCFTYPVEEKMRQHAGDRMQNAALSFYRHSEMGEELSEYITFERKMGEGIYFILDLKEETAGYLEFDIEVPEDCLMEVGWGEHLVDGRCRSAVGKRNEKGATGRNFSVTARLQAGRNHYRNPFRRLGGRYLQFFLQTSEVKVYAAGICPTVYPVKQKEYKTVQTSNLQRVIYLNAANSADNSVTLYPEVATLSFDAIGGKDVMPIGGYYGPAVEGIAGAGDVSYDHFTAATFNAIKDAGVNLLTYVNLNYNEYTNRVNTYVLDLAGNRSMGVFVMDRSVTDQEYDKWYGYAQTANTQIAAADEYLMNAISDGIIVCGTSATSDTAAFTDRISGTAYNELTGVSGDAIIGCFNYAGKTALYVTNYDSDNAQDITLTFDGDYTVTCVDSGVKSDLAITGSGTQLSLAAGEGVLLVFDK